MNVPAPDSPHGLLGGRDRGAVGRVPQTSTPRSHSSNHRVGSGLVCSLSGFSTAERGRDRAGTTRRDAQAGPGRCGSPPAWRPGPTGGHGGHPSSCSWQGDGLWLPGRSQQPRGPTAPCPPGASHLAKPVGRLGAFQESPGSRQRTRPAQPRVTCLFQAPPALPGHWPWEPAARGPRGEEGHPQALRGQEGPRSRAAAEVHELGDPDKAADSSGPSARKRKGRGPRSEHQRPVPCSAQTGRKPRPARPTGPFVCPLESTRRQRSPGQAGGPPGRPASRSPWPRGWAGP